jgi:hypothetical protein
VHLAALDGQLCAAKRVHADKAFVEIVDPEERAAQRRSRAYPA